MPRYIIKLDEYYLEWSTVLDAPLTFGMNYEELTAYIKEEYGSQGLKKLPGWIEKSKNDVEELLDLNRAGFAEKELSKEEIIEWYCVKKQYPPIL